MATHVALLRAINLGSHNKIRMSDLRDWLRELGFAEPRSVLQSGNLVFSGGRRTGARLEKFLETEAANRLDLDTDFVVRTADELDAVIRGNPFQREAKRDPRRLLVTFLKSAPETKRVRALRAAQEGPEVVKARQRELYGFYPKGIGTSRLTHATIERKLGVRGTGRGWNTVLKLADLVG